MFTVAFKRKYYILAFGSLQVLHFSKFLILQTASPDSIFRLKSTAMDKEEVHRIKDMYFYQQHHGCLKDLLQYYLCHKKGEKLLFQVFSSI